MEKENIIGRQCQMITSQKNNDMLFLDGFSYYFHRITKRWRCTKRQDPSIKCSCNLKADEKYYVTNFYNSHNHASDAEKFPVMEVVNSIKETAGTSNNLPCQILQASIATVPEVVAGCLPSKSALTQIVKRVKKKQLEKEPECLVFEIPVKYKEINGEKFVLADEMIEQDRIIICSTSSNLRRMKEAEFWMMDGTFKVVPKVFFQLYTIHCSIGPYKTVHPMMYGVMSGKSTALYQKMFNMLNEKALEIGIGLSPKIIITDFEKAAINSIRTVFEGVTVKGCNFHFMQNLYRHIQAIGWQTRYGSDINFALKVRIIAALCFLQPKEIPEWFTDIRAELGPEFDPLTDWLGEHYITGKNGRGPTFPPNLWSVFEQNTLGIPRTQNYAESFHRYFNTVIGRPHIGVFRLLQELQKNATMTNAEIEKLERGNPPPSKKRKYLIKENNINLILLKKKEYSKFGFLKAIAGNICF